MQAKIVLPNEELEYGAAEAIKTLRTKLARSFAALGKNTVLMDCDMRKSYLVRRLGIQEKIQGVSEYLSKQSMKIVYRTSRPEFVDYFQRQLSAESVGIIVRNTF